MTSLHVQDCHVLCAALIFSLAGQRASGPSKKNSSKSTAGPVAGAIAAAVAAGVSGTTQVSTISVCGFAM